MTFCVSGAGVLKNLGEGSSACKTFPAKENQGSKLPGSADPGGIIQFHDCRRISEKRS
jgi:hypothetical protein